MCLDESLAWCTRAMHPAAFSHCSSSTAEDLPWVWGLGTAAQGTFSSYPRRPSQFFSTLLSSLIPSLRAESWWGWEAAICEPVEPEGKLCLGEGSQSLLWEGIQSLRDSLWCPNHISKCRLGLGADLPGLLDNTSVMLI